MNLDGTQWGNMVDTALSKPFLLASSDWPDTHPDFNAVAYHQGSSKDFYIAKVKQSGHSNFMDIPRVINLPALNEAGTIEPTKATQITVELNDLVKKYPALLLKKQALSN